MLACTPAMREAHDDTETFEVSGLFSLLRKEVDLVHVLYAVICYKHTCTKGCSRKKTCTPHTHTHTLRHTNSQANHSLHFAWEININEDYYVTAVHPRENKRLHLSHTLSLSKPFPLCLFCTLTHTHTQTLVYPQTRSF